jgi:antitoxin (DNA-binding transcriptional repressor) of toxin-antitoxin stability system
MSTITLEEIQRNPKGLLERVRSGETLLLTENDQALAEIKPLIHKAKVPRPYGLSKGEFVVPDDFDDPLPDEFYDLFEGKE